VLHVLRDRLTAEQAVHFGAQLPLLVRGLYYEGWRLADKPAGERQPAEFAALVAAQLPEQFGRDALRVTKAVFELLAKELDPGETAKIVATLPVPLRSLWPATSASSIEWDSRRRRCALMGLNSARLRSTGRPTITT